MTREEIVDLLEIMVAAYPATKIRDPKRTVDAWQLAFSEAKAQDVYKAARFHMQRSPYFPTVSDINASMKYTFMYEDDTKRIEAKEEKEYDLCTKDCSMCPDFNSAIGCIDAAMRGCYEESQLRLDSSDAI